MQFKSLITCSAMVLAFGIGSAIAAEPVEKKSIMPQNVQAMTAADLEKVRGTWGMPGPANFHALGNPGHLNTLNRADPPGQDKAKPYD